MYFHQALIFKVNEREEMMCWTGASVLLNHECRPEGLYMQEVCLGISGEGGGGDGKQD